MRICVANVAQAYSEKLAKRISPALKEHQNPTNQALKGIARDFYRAQVRKDGKQLVQRVKQAARASDSDFGYLMMTLLEGRDTWPVSQKMANGLDVIADVMRDSGKIPKYKVNAPRSDRGDENVDKALRRLAQWVQTYYKADLQESLEKHARNWARKLRKTSKIRLTEDEITEGLMTRFATRIRQGALSVQNGSPIRRIVRLLYKK